MPNGDPIIELEKALSLVFDSQALVVKGLRANPDKDEKRALLKRLARLRVEEADLIALIDAHEDEPGGDFPAPDDDQVREIARLTGEVEAAARRNVTASAALSLTEEVLDLAIAVTGD